MLLGRRVARPLAGEQGDSEHRERERGDGQSRQHRVVLEHDLQEQRQGDHGSAQCDVLQHLSGGAEPEDLGSEQVGVEQRGLASPLSAHQPPDQCPHGEGADRDEGGDRLPSLLPREDAQHDAAHAEDGQHRAAHVDASIAGVRDVANAFDVQQHGRDDDDLEEEPHPPRQVRGDEAAEQRSDGGGDRRGGADLRVDPPLSGPFEVAVDQGLHGGEQQRGSEPTDDGPEEDDRCQALGEGHRRGADRIAQQAQHEGPLASDQIPNLAADQDERGRHQRFECDRRLDPARGRVQISNHRGDRHVHERGVDDEHEHRHGEQEREPWIVHRRCRLAAVRLGSA